MRVQAARPVEGIYKVALFVEAVRRVCNLGAVYQRKR